MTNTNDRFRNGHQIAAKLVARGGVAFLPMFERMEGEVSRLESTESAVDRAIRLARSGL